jgi:hypothetical protein
MVVSNYRGLPFSQLERGFAGLMLRDSMQDLHFDLSTVALRFDLHGDNGTYSRSSSISRPTPSTGSTSTYAASSR